MDNIYTLDEVMTGNWNKPAGDILFLGDKKLEIIKLCANGDILVKGKLIENDVEVVNALREFIGGMNNVNELWRM